MKASLFNYTSRWFLPGLIAGVVFLAIAMVGGALSTTAWAMPSGIAQAVGISAPAGYGFAFGALLVGIAVHLAISIGLGALFIAVADWRRLHGWVLVVAAVIFAALEPGVAIWGVLHNVLSANTFHFFLGAIPLWASVLGHCIYGLVLGLLLAGPFSATWKASRPTVQH